MPKQKKNILFAVSLFTLLIISSVMAYFSAADTVTNRFKVKNLDIILTETKWVPSKGENVVPNEEFDKNPEITNNDRTDAYVFLRVTVPYIQGVTIEYRADQSVTDVDGNTVISARHGQDIPRTAEPMPMFKFIVTDSEGNDSLSETLTYEQLVHNECWYLLSYEIDKSARNIVYVYAYAANTDSEGVQLISLSQGETTAYPLFDKIRLINYDEGAFLNGSYTVDVTALAIQTNYLIDGETSSSDPAKVWEILNNESGGREDD